MVRGGFVAVRAVAGMAIGVALFTSVIAGTAAAEETSDTTAPGRFINGEASASADTFGVTITQGNADIGFTYGRSIASYADVTGTAEARALDLGVLPTLFGVEQCDGSAPVLNPATFPPLTRADSTDAAAAGSRLAEAFMPGTGVAPAGPSAGFQDATATPQPSSAAVTDSADADLFLVALNGGHTEVTTQLADDVREAHAVVSADQLKVFGGLFTFQNPRWEAVARSGRVTTAEGRFSFTGATVLGLPRSPADAMADLEGFKIGLEQLLAPLGVTLDLPTVEVTDNRVRVTPMAFRIIDPPWGAQVIAPFLSDIQPLRESLVQQSLDEDCKNETTILLLDVLLGVVAGSGSIDIAAGGVDVRTDDTDFPRPQPVTTTVPRAAPTNSGGAGTLGYDEYTPGSYSPGSSPDSGFDPGDLSELTSDDLLGDIAVEVAGASESNDEALASLPSSATSRFEDPGAGGAAVTVGVLVLLGALGLVFGERMMSRRTDRRIP